MGEEPKDIKAEAVAYIKAKWYELRRILFSMAVVGLCAIFVLPAADRQVILYKAATVTFAWAVWHVLRVQGFPYLDFSAALDKGNGTAIAAAILLGLTCIAVVLGISSAF